MQKFLISLCALCLLSGCLGKLERSTDETKAEVQKTNVNLDTSNRGILLTAEILKELQKDAKFGVGFAGIYEKGRPASARVLTAVLAILMSEDTALNGIVGAPFLIGYPDYVKEGKSYPNVSLISQDLEVKLGTGSALDVSSWKVLILACEQLGNYFNYAFHSGKVSNEAVQLANKQFPAYVEACTAVAGGRPAVGSTFRPSGDSEDALIKEKRNLIEKQMLDEFAHFPDKKLYFDSLIEQRLRGNFDEWVGK